MNDYRELANPLAQGTGTLPLTANRSGTATPNASTARFQRFASAPIPPPPLRPTSPIAKHETSQTTPSVANRTSRECLPLAVVRPLRHHRLGLSQRTQRRRRRRSQHLPAAEAPGPRLDALDQKFPAPHADALSPKILDRDQAQTHWGDTRLGSGAARLPTRWPPPRSLYPSSRSTC